MASEESSVRFPDKSEEDIQKSLLQEVVSPSTRKATNTNEKRQKTEDDREI